ncbi:GTPase activating protein (SH3 domain) binding protein [Seminavis robusta]|uniref:GTPase activating protein (SH3 domain) binding protein n=1 Tax=Seminavis robusta TaxID=568900 RepID=A0A9N8H6D7_9STRA|nr:GTPase activating protein (SH3 domain) binding protein [Seminavis robusta]|eukprot:Sro143_g066650.1 GTPase activating protein (SH3 domain) binding protein (528) ;mRNA; r:59469-61277
MSGASTPRGNRSPPPDGQQSSGPQGVTAFGIRFVRQYYGGMLDDPKKICPLYEPTSLMTDGLGTEPTESVPYETDYKSNPEKLKDRFSMPDFAFRLELGHGAIDAQQSVNGGALLVVTGKVAYTPIATEDEDAAVDDPIWKSFVHTFFLLPRTAGTKKSWYVHNDILRFLKDTAEVVPPPVVAEAPPPVVATEPVPVAAPPVVSEPAPEPVPPEQPAPPAVPEQPTPQQTPAPPEVVVEEPKVVEEEKKPVVEAASPVPPVEEVEEEAPGGGVEETKEELPTPPPKPAKADKPKKENNKAAKKEESEKEQQPSNRKGNKKIKEIATVADAGRKSPVPPPSPAPKPPPGSWASLVAGAPAASAAVKTAPPPTAVKPPPKPPNLPDNTKESDVLGVFEPFAGQTKSRVVGITVAAHRGIAFVDYDSINPVMKAVSQHKEEPIRLMGRILEVDQKTAEQRARREAQQRRGGGGGNYRSGSPSHNNGGSNRYGGGGGDGRRGGGGHRRRDGGGRGDRGGGGMGGRGGRGGR